MNNSMHHGRDHLDDSEMMYSLGSSLETENNASLISLGSVDYTDSARALAPSANESSMGKFAQSASSVADSAVSSLASTFANLLKQDNEPRDGDLDLGSADFGDADLKLVSNNEAFAANEDEELDSIRTDADDKSSDSNYFIINENQVANDEASVVSTIDNLSPDGSFIGGGIAITTLGENHDPHAGEVVLDAEQEQRYASNRERISAGVSDILTLKDDKRATSVFTVVERDLSMFETTRLESNVFSEEEEVSGSSEAEDFVSGNVTVIEEALMTGTDSAGRASAVGAAGQTITIEDEEDFEKVEGVDTKRTYGSTLTFADDSDAQREQRLLPMLMREFGNNWLTYSLAITVCVLCLFKVYQVQETRDITAHLNEVRFTNEELEKQQLILIAQKQRLSEHASIRTVASGVMNMTSPKTENEVVISLK